MENSEMNWRVKVFSVLPVNIQNPMGLNNLVIKKVQP